MLSLRITFGIIALSLTSQRRCQPSFAWGGNPQVNRICQENRIHPLGLVLSTLEKDMQHEVNMLSNFIALNTVSFKGPGRRQRSAPLSLIGGLSRTLFGTATVEDLQIVANRVNDLISRNRNITGAILSHAKNFKSYMRIVNVRFQNMGNMIDGVITNMKGFEDRLNAIVDEIKALTFLAANVTDSFKYNINEIRDAIIDLQKGYISEFLIPDEDFRAAIDKIIQKAAETYSNTNIVNRAVHY